MLQGYHKGFAVGILDLGNGAWLYHGDEDDTCTSRMASHAVWMVSCSDPTLGVDHDRQSFTKADRFLTWWEVRPDILFPDSEVYVA